jgi:hypothetical protein
VVGAGYYGARQLGFVDAKQEARLRELRARIGDRQADAKAVLTELVRTSVCATAAGWFQVYSGGIIIDTVATRLQAGQTVNAALWGLRSDQNVTEVVQRYVRQSAHVYRRIPDMASKTHEVYWALLKRSNLMAGHFVTMMSRFPYLLLNFTTYQQTERLLIGMRPPATALSPNKSVAEELACVSASTLVSTTAITVAECPKIIDQVTAKCGQRSTVMSIYRTYGVKRLFQGYTACFCREYLFNTALLMSPSLASAIRARVDPDSWFAKAIHGNEIVVASLALGMPMGILTNVPDQLKTRIQMGQFLNMREAWAHQKTNGGVRGLFGMAAAYRGLFITHAVVAFNFARDRVERYFDS